MEKIQCTEADTKVCPKCGEISPSDAPSLRLSIQESHRPMRCPLGHTWLASVYDGYREPIYARSDLSALDELWNLVLMNDRQDRVEALDAWECQWLGKLRTKAFINADAWRAAEKTGLQSLRALQDEAITQARKQLGEAAAEQNARVISEWLREELSDERACWLELCVLLQKPSALKADP